MQISILFVYSLIGNMSGKCLCLSLSCSLYFSLINSLLPTTLVLCSEEGCPCTVETSATSLVEPEMHHRNHVLVDQFPSKSLVKFSSWLYNFTYYELNFIIRKSVNPNFAIVRSKFTIKVCSFSILWAATRCLYLHLLIKVIFSIVHENLQVQLFKASSELKFWITVVSNFPKLWVNTLF